MYTFGEEETGGTDHVTVTTRGSDGGDGWFCVLGVFGKAGFAVAFFGDFRVRRFRLRRAGLGGVFRFGGFGLRHGGFRFAGFRLRVGGFFGGDFVGFRVRRFRLRRR